MRNLQVVRFVMSSKMKKLRKEKGLGQKDISQLLDMPVRTYGSYERGERTLSLDVAAKIADILDVTLDELLEREHKAPVLTLDWNERALIQLYRSMKEVDKETFMNLAHTLARAGSVNEVTVASVSLEGEE